MSVSPWSLLFSRAAFEANLSLTLLVLGLVFLIRHPGKTGYLLLAVSFFALSAYAYQANRYLAFAALLYFVGLKKSLTFVLLLLPQLLLIGAAGPNARASDLAYFSPHPAFIAEFLSRWISYFSPKNLFFLSGSDLHRTIPDLSVFYPWMLVPWLFGLKYLGRFRWLGYLTVLSPVMAALTRDPFAAFRALPFLWSMGLLISLGINDLWPRLSRKYSVAVLFLLFTFSALHLYSSYLILLPATRSRDWGLAYRELVAKVQTYPGANFVIDSSRDQPPHIFFLFYTRFPPQKFQALSGSGVLADYYNSVDFSRNYLLANIDIRPVSWATDSYQNQILVGDPLTISPAQAAEHFLTPVFTVKDHQGETVLTGFRTQPDRKCAANPVAALCPPAFLLK